MRYKGQGFDLKSFRRKRKLSQKEISEAVNLPQSFLSAIENGKKSAPDSFIDELARIYNVDNISDYITDRRDSEEPKSVDIKEAIVDSKGLNINLNGIKGETANTIISLLGTIIPDLQVKTSKETDEIVLEKSASTVDTMVKLLAKSEERCTIAEQRIKELEKEISDLKSKSPKRRKQQTCN